MALSETLPEYLGREAQFSRRNFFLLLGAFFFFLESSQGLS